MWVRMRLDISWSDLVWGLCRCITAISIPDMVRIIESHGLVPVPIDLREGDLAPDDDALRRGSDWPT